MSINPHHMFKGFDDYKSWDNYILQCQVIEGLTNEQKQDALEAISHLRQVFGESFLHKAFRTHPVTGHAIAAHPLTKPLVDAAPCNKLWLIHFASALKSLHGGRNFDALLDRLRDPSEYAEGITVLEVGYKFFQSGFTVELDPDVEVHNAYGGSRSRVPDLRILDYEMAEDIFVEVSRLRTSERQDMTSRTYHAFFDLLYRNLWAANMLSYARVTQTLDEEELEDAVTQVKGLIEEAYNSGEFRELTVEGVFEVGVAPPAEGERVQAWAAQRGIKDTLEGPLIPLNEVWRARGKLRKELKQLPDNKPGIVVLPTHENLLFFTYDIQQIISEIEEEARRNPKLLCAVLHHSFIEGGNNEVTLAKAGLHTLIRKKKVDYSTEQTLIIINQDCAFPVSDKVFEKMIAAFVRF